jgi:hypothetical protein
MKAGESVFLASSPECRGTVSLVESDRFLVTWHAYSKDRPEVLSEKMGVNVQDASQRTRVWYMKSETANLGFGVPS